MQTKHTTTTGAVRAIQDDRDRNATFFVSPMGCEFLEVWFNDDVTAEARDRIERVVSAEIEAILRETQEAADADEPQPPEQNFIFCEQNEDGICVYDHHETLHVTFTERAKAERYAAVQAKRLGCSWGSNY